MSLTPRVGVLMGSTSDWDVMQSVPELLQEFGVSYEARVISAHRTPSLLADYARTAKTRGFKLLIAGAGGAAHLPGMLAAHTTLPVVGVPIPATVLQGMDSLLSIVQMPRGVPVATMAIGRPGAANAAILAVQILSLGDCELGLRLERWSAAQAEQVLAQRLDV